MTVERKRDFFYSSKNVLFLYFSLLDAIKVSNDNCVTQVLDLFYSLTKMT